MIVTHESERAALQDIGKIVAQVLQRMGEALEPGMTTRELDALGLQWLTEAGARSAPQVMYKFPGATCISVNHQVAHGIPGDYVIQAGDMVNIDVSAEKNGFFGDTGTSFCVGKPTPSQARLLQAGRDILALAMEVATAGAKINEIGRVISQESRERGYTFIRNLGSHGVGLSLHEAPKFIAPYYDRQDKRRLKEGMVITIEPFISNGAHQVEEADDGWTLYTAKRFQTVQFEHSMLITKQRPLILTEVVGSENVVA